MGPACGAAGVCSGWWLSVLEADPRKRAGDRRALAFRHRRAAFKPAGLVGTGLRPRSGRRRGLLVARRVGRTSVVPRVPVGAPGAASSWTAEVVTTTPHPAGFPHISGGSRIPPRLDHSGPTGLPYSSRALALALGASTCPAHERGSGFQIGRLTTESEGPATMSLRAARSSNSRTTSAVGCNRGRALPLLHAGTRTSRPLKR
jgi:hypothetical protein